MPKLRRILRFSRQILLQYDKSKQQLFFFNVLTNFFNLLRTASAYLKWFGTGRGPGHLKPKHADTKCKMEVFQVLSQYCAKKCTLGKSSGCQTAQLVWRWIHLLQYSKQYYQLLEISKWLCKISSDIDSVFRNETRKYEHKRFWFPKEWIQKLQHSAMLWHVIW